MTISPARQVAFQILTDIAEGKAYTNFALREAFRRVRLEERDRALCSEIVYGTVQREKSIDALIQLHMERKIKTLDARVLTILRMAIYQFAFLNKVPAYAILNESVEICKRVHPKASGFVNGVLRAYTRTGKTASDLLAELSEKYKKWADKMALIHSYPTWLIEKWEREFGRDRTERVLVASNQPSGMSLRVNPLRATRDEILSELEEQGHPAQASALCAEGIRLLRGMDVEKSTLYTSGKVTVQDEGAMLIAPLLQLKPGMRVLDMCAAPGTKTTHIAELMSDEGSVHACDVHEHKRELIWDATRRLHLESIEAITADARTLPDPSATEPPYDAVLLDAPCSGFGVLAHRPDIRWRRTEKDVRALTELQRGLLEKAIRMVKPGGVIVYSTCTLLSEENEELVNSVVRESQGAVVWDDITGDLPAPVQARASIENPDGAMGFLLTPDQFGTDGFYMARLKKQ